MKTDSLTLAQEQLWRISAGLIPGILLATQLTWAETIAAIGISLVLGLIVRKLPTGKFVHWIAGVIGVSLGAVLLETFCPETSGFWVAAILTALACWTGTKERETTAYAGILLLWITGILAGSLLLSMLPEVEAEKLRLKGSQGIRREALHLVLVFLLPEIRIRKSEGSQERTDHKWKRTLGTICILFSLCAP